MRIAKQTPTVLKIKTNKRIRLLVFGIVIFILGLLTIILVRVQPLSQSDLQLSRIFYQQKESVDSYNPDSQNLSLANTAFRLTYYVGSLMFIRERPVAVLATLALIVGFMILISPIRNQVVTFDKSAQQVELKQPRWFFRSHVETHPFHTISDVSVEREQASTKSRKIFGVILVISHSEGKPLSRNYVHYRTILLVSQSYRLEYEEARTMVEKIQGFMAGA